MLDSHAGRGALPLPAPELVRAHCRTTGGDPANNRPRKAALVLNCHAFLVAHDDEHLDALAQRDLEAALTARRVPRGRP